MRLLIAISYYHPYISGLTIYIQKLAEALVTQGYEVTIITSQYDKNLKSKEILNGVNIIRLPVQFWISKGAIMLSYFKDVANLVDQYDLVMINLPNTFVETFSLLFHSKLKNRPIIGLYHCDVELPKGLFNTLVNFVVFVVNIIAGKFVDKLISYTEDFSNSSKVLRYFKEKTIIIPPPVTIPQSNISGVAELREKYSSNNEPVIGFAGRFAAEKGIHILIGALPYIHEKFSNAKIVFAGEYKNVIGEQKYFVSLRREFERHSNHIAMLGPLPSEQLANFYAFCDVLVLPSINNTETFGFVQVESMLCGTPVVASDLPGVRVPVMKTGMGIVVRPGDSKLLADAIVSVLLQKEKFFKQRNHIEMIFSLEHTVKEYLELFRELIKSRRG